jgi:hypothetical protein
MQGSKQTVTLEKDARDVHIAINFWPVLWTVVGALIWAGLLHLAHVV